MNNRTTIPSSSLEIYPQRLNWKQIADDIQQSGLSYNSQAELMGYGWSTVQKWLTGGEPRYAAGVAWLQLHTNICGPDLTRQRLREIREMV